MFPQEFLEKCLKNAEDLIDSLSLTYSYNFQSNLNEHNNFKRQILLDKNYKKVTNNKQDHNGSNNVSSFSFNTNISSGKNLNSKLQKTIESNKMQPLNTPIQTTSPEELRMISNLHSIQTPFSGTSASTANLMSMPPAINSLSVLNSSKSPKKKDYISENEQNNSDQSYLTFNSDKEDLNTVNHQIGIIDDQTNSEDNEKYNK